METERSPSETLRPDPEPRRDAPAAASPKPEAQKDGAATETWRITDWASI